MWHLKFLQFFFQLLGLLPFSLKVTNHNYSLSVTHLKTWFIYDSFLIIFVLGSLPTILEHEKRYFSDPFVLIAIANYFQLASGCIVSSLIIFFYLHQRHELIEILNEIWHTGKDSKFFIRTTLVFTIPYLMFCIFWWFAVKDLYDLQYAVGFFSNSAIIFTLVQYTMIMKIVFSLAERNNEFSNLEMTKNYFSICNLCGRISRFYGLPSFCSIIYIFVTSVIFGYMFVTLLLVYDYIGDQMLWGFAYIIAFFVVSGLQMYNLCNAATAVENEVKTVQIFFAFFKLFSKC